MYFLIMVGILYSFRLDIRLALDLRDDVRGFDIFLPAVVGFFEIAGAQESVHPRLRLVIAVLVAVAMADRNATILLCTFGS